MRRRDPNSTVTPAEIFAPMLADMDRSIDEISRRAADLLAHRDPGPTAPETFVHGVSGAVRSTQPTGKAT